MNARPSDAAGSGAAWRGRFPPPCGQNDVYVDDVEVVFVVCAFGLDAWLPSEHLHVSCYRFCMLGRVGAIARCFRVFNCTFLHASFVNRV